MDDSRVVVQPSHVKGTEPSVEIPQREVRGPHRRIVRDWGPVLLAGWTGIVFVIALSVLCGLEIGLVIAGNAYRP